MIQRQMPTVFSQNSAMYSFSAFSILEYLFRDTFQFSRPYIAELGVEIGRPGERLHDLIYSVLDLLLLHGVFGFFDKVHHRSIEGCSLRILGDVVPSKVILVRTDRASWRASA